MSQKYSKFLPIGACGALFNHATIYIQPFGTAPGSKSIMIAAPKEYAHRRLDTLCLCREHSMFLGAIKWFDSLGSRELEKGHLCLPSNAGNSILAYARHINQANKKI